MGISARLESNDDISWNLPLLFLTVPQFCLPDIISVFQFSMLFLTNTFCIFSATGNIIHFFNELWGTMPFLAWSVFSCFLWNYFIIQQMLFCPTRLWLFFFPVATISLSRWSCGLSLKYSSEYLPHKRQAYYWPKVVDIIPVLPIFYDYLLFCQ